MSEVVADAVVHPILARARTQALAVGLPFAGAVTPHEAWTLAQAGIAKLVDIRSNEEITFVGHVPGALHIVWASGTSLTRNPRFLRELQAKIGKDDIVLLLCRSGKRSAEAAELATKAGFAHVYNVLEGFEGELNELQQRGTADGWRFRGLPWVQN